MRIGGHWGQETGLTWDGARGGGKEQAKEKKAIWFGGGKGGGKVGKISLRNNKCFGPLFSEQKRGFLCFY